MMRIKSLTALASAGLLIMTGAAAYALSSGSVLAAGHPMRITCTIRLGANNSPGRAQGQAFIFASCGKPLGKGIWYDLYTITGKAGVVTEKGTEKEYFNTGTLHGSLRSTVNEKAAGQPITTVVTITGGTGAFSAARGSARSTCVSTKSTCRATVTLSRL